MQSYVTGEIIRGLREKRRLTQRDLAQRLNVPGLIVPNDGHV